MCGVTEGVWAWSEAAAPPPRPSVTMGKPPQNCPGHSCQLQVTSEDLLSPATLQPVTPAPGPVASSTLLCPVPPLLCLRTGPCGNPQKSKLSSVQICSVRDHLDPVGYAIVPSVLGWEHFCFDGMAMFSMGNR